MNTLAIIPARGGSKRIPHKNIKPFLGRPVIDYAIQAAKKSGLFSEIMVSTDDPEIQRIALSCGAKVPFMRTPQTASDTAPLSVVFSEVLKSYSKIGRHFAYFCAILPVTPLLDYKLLNTSFHLLHHSHLNGVIPVIAYSHPIQRALKINSRGYLQMLDSSTATIRTQDLPKRYHDSGQFYFLKTTAFFKQRKIFMTNIKSLEIPEIASQDIDTLEDWHLAELKYQLWLKQKV